MAGGAPTEAPASVDLEGIDESCHLQMVAGRTCLIREVLANLRLPPTPLQLLLERHICALSCVPDATPTFPGAPPPC